jgi:hypothetical protein
MLNIHREVEITVDEVIEELAKKSSNWNLFYNNTL